MQNVAHQAAQAAKETAGQQDKPAEQNEKPSEQHEKPTGTKRWDQWHPHHFLAVQTITKHVMNS